MKEIGPYSKTHGFLIKLNTEPDKAKKRMKLQAACPDEVNKLLFEYVGAKTLNSC